MAAHLDIEIVAREEVHHMDIEVVVSGLWQELPKEENLARAGYRRLLVRNACLEHRAAHLRAEIALLTRALVKAVICYI